MPATREHLMMVLADLDDVLVRASYSTEMRSSSISHVSMEVALPGYSGLARALEVEQCRCPPAYQGLSCQVPPLHRPGSGPGSGSDPPISSGLCSRIHPDRRRPVPGPL